MREVRTIPASAGNTADVVDVYDTHFDKVSDPTFYEPAVCLSIDRKWLKTWASSKTTHLTPTEARDLGRELIAAADRAEAAEIARRSPR